MTSKTICAALMLLALARPAASHSPPVRPLEGVVLDADAILVVSVKTGPRLAGEVYAAIVSETIKGTLNRGVEVRVRSLEAPPMSGPGPHEAFELGLRRAIMFLRWDDGVPAGWSTNAYFDLEAGESEVFLLYRPRPPNVFLDAVRALHALQKPGDDVVGHRDVWLRLLESGNPLLTAILLDRMRGWSYREYRGPRSTDLRKRVEAVRSRFAKELASAALSLGTDPDPEVRSKAIFAVADRWPSIDAPSAQLRKRARAAGLAGLHHAEAEVREAALRLLAALGDRACFAPIVRDLSAAEPSPANAALRAAATLARSTQLTEEETTTLTKLAFRSLYRKPLTGNAMRALRVLVKSEYAKIAGQRRGVELAFWRSWGEAQGFLAPEGR